MEKIIMIMNSHQIDMPTIDFACYLAKLTKSRLTCLLVENEFFDLIPPVHHHESYFEQPKPGSQPRAATGVKMDTDQSMRLYQDACERREVNSEAFVIKGHATKEVIHESRFADLLVIDPGTNFSKKAEGTPTHFVKDVMAHAECPVVIAPELFDGIGEITFCYDGSKSSVFAMKQFAYLFPEYHSLKTTLLEIRNPETTVVDGDHVKILSWLKRHFDVSFTYVIKGDVKGELLSYFLDKKNTFVVMGAYGRNALSYFFKGSKADLLMSVADLPLFVAHY